MNFGIHGDHGTETPQILRDRLCIIFWWFCVIQEYILEGSLCKHQSHIQAMVGGEWWRNSCSGASKERFSQSYLL